MKLKKRWQRTSVVRWDDFHYKKVPWWLRIKRFTDKPRTDKEYNQDQYDSYLDRMYDP